MKRLEVKIAQQNFGNVRRIVVTSALGCAIAGKMLRAGQNACVAPACALEATHLRARHRRTQIRIFPRAFHNASPAGIARDIQHGRKSPLNARSACILSSHPLRLLFDRRIP